MRILYRPRVALKAYLPNSEREIEEAARVCWESWGRSDGSLQDSRNFIARLQKVGHIDTLEESFASFWLECSRACSHQVVRHRTFHFLQQSQRYVKLDEPEFLVPPSIANADPEILAKFFAKREDNWQEYRDLREAGVRAEDARYCLPNATLTKLKLSANFNNWRKFIELRSHSSAQWEVRMASNTILAMLHGLAPQVFGDLKEKFLVPEALYADPVERTEFDNDTNRVLDPLEEEDAA